MNDQLRPNAIRLYQLKRHNAESLKQLKASLIERHGRERNRLSAEQENLVFRKAEPLASDLAAASLLVEEESLREQIDETDSCYIRLNERVVWMQRLFELFDYANVPDGQRMNDASLILLKCDSFGPTVPEHILDALKRLPLSEKQDLQKDYLFAISILKASNGHGQFTHSLEMAFPHQPAAAQKPPLVKRSPRKAVRKNATWQPGATARQNPFGNNFARQCLHEFNIKAEFVALSLGNKVPEEDNARTGSQSQLLRSNMLDRIHNIYNYINGFEGTEQIPDLRNIEDFLNNLNLVVAAAILFKHGMGDSPDAALTLSSMASSYFNDTSELNKAMDKLGLDQSLSGFACSMLESYRHMKKERK